MTPDEYRRAAGLPPLTDTATFTVLPFAVTLPMPPSENGLWANAEHRVTGASIRVLTSQARAYRRAIAGSFPAGFRLDPKGLYRLLWLFGYPWYTKKGKLKIWDAPNRMKFMQDCIAKFAGIDDSRFKEPALFERNCPDPFVRICIVPWAKQTIPVELA